MRNRVPLIMAFMAIYAVGLCQEIPRRPVSTYSIVARDANTGELGVAVQSHWFSVGSIVTWAEAGVGAVATQSFVEVSYGPLGLELMRAGKTAKEALSALLSVDEQAEVRQVAFVDARGNVAAHTGAKCIIAAGHIEGDQYAVQANLMEKNTVWGAMSRAYESARGDLIDRLMAALVAAEKEGGDIRGRQSAAILIVPAKSDGAPWRERVIDLRVEDHPEPLVELKRLVQVHRAYNHMNQGDAYFSAGDVDRALEEYAAARKILPQSLEVKYWEAITMAGAGRVDDAMPLFRDVFRKGRNWLELTTRLPHSGLLPDDKELIDRILSAGK